MIDALGAILVLFCGTAFVWIAVNLTAHLVRLVRPPRPAHFVCLHMTAVWSVGSVSVLVGLTLIAQGLAMLSYVSQ